MAKFKIIGEVRGKFEHVVEADSEAEAMAIAEREWENGTIYVDDTSFDWVDETVETVPA